MNKPGRLETALFLIGILLIGMSMRLVGIEWGEGQPIHPDEEFLRGVTAAVEWPDSPGLYFDSAASPLSPYNRGHGFFVYGTLPLFVTRGTVEALDRSCEALNEGRLTPAALLARWLSPIVLAQPTGQCWPGAFSSVGIRTIGRALAALFDLGCLLFVYLAGRRLGSRWLGLLAAMLYALAVLPIQQAHFYTVDAFANFFVAVALYMVLWAAQSGKWAAFALAGLATGLGMACKISVWPLALMVALAGIVRWLLEVGDRGARRQGNEETKGQGDLSSSSSPPPPLPLSPSPPLLLSLSQIALAGVVAFIAFRLAQPYAFRGPGFFGLALNEQWLSNMAEVRGLMSGAVDTYPGHQWTNRTPLLFPWVNIVFWGLGLPLGLVAWAGWAAALVLLIRRWRKRRASLLEPTTAALLLLWTWTSGYFVYQGAQWVKSMRYLLPIYPALVLLAAWLAMTLIERAQRRWARWAGSALAALAVGGALVWALAFMSIYTHSHTRVAASRWIFEHVPTAATVYLRTAAGERQVQVTLIGGTVLMGDMPTVAEFQVPEEGDVTRVTLNYVSDPNGDAEAEVLRLALATDGNGQTVLAEATVAVDAPPRREGVVVTFPLSGVRLLPGSRYYLLVDATAGAPAMLYTSVLATEHWDWAPPLRVDGHDPFGGMYRGLTTSPTGELLLYHEDTLDKREQLLDWLDEADYIITASNRLYASIPRLPTRYPLTIAYYQALFSGELGFELVADFASYPALGPVNFPDQEKPFAVPQAAYQYLPASLSIMLPPAEEAFSVYDHPRVLIFRKTAAYSRERAEALLPESLLDNVIWVTPRQATRGVRQPLLDAETWAAQRAGGTWSAMFDRQSLLNRSSLLAAVVWYLAATALGWLAFPLLFAALPRLRDRGYGVARALGLLGLSYTVWLLASLRLLPNTRGTILAALFLWAALSGLLAWRQRHALRAFLRQERTTILVYEGLFLFLFAAWAAVRALNPDLWHPVVGGEKPMDLAYLNAVIKSTWFPPYDPWFAGGYINYYYFGFVLVSTLTRLLGILPTISYNLALALFYALTGGAAFSVAFNLTGDEKKPLRPYMAGLLAVLLLLILGNLGEIRLLVNGFRMVAGEPTFQSTIPGFAELVQAIKGFGMVLRGASLPFRPETPYWEPTRMLPADEWGVGPITEFPAFTFLYADLHAHMLALPYGLTAVALALNWARGDRRLLSLLPGGLVIGSLLAMNTWDYPTYLLLALAGMTLGTDLWGQETAQPWKRRVLSLGGRAALLVGLTLLLFQPYRQNYVAGYTRIQRWEGLYTPLGIYLLLVGQFLFPLLTLLGGDVRRVWQRVAAVEGGSLRLPLALAALGLATLSMALALSGIHIALLTLPVAALALALTLDAQAPPARRLVWFCVSLAMGLCLAVEIVVLVGDIGRMNTVFKFYNQVWVLLAVSAAAALVWLIDRLERWPIDLSQSWWLAMGLLLCVAALFPVMSIRARVTDRIEGSNQVTLDGMAYMQYGLIWDVRGQVDLQPDYEAIVWLQDHVEGSPVLIEGLGEREYLWGNRVSIYTGLPTIVGWRWHQYQQRIAANPEQVNQRQIDVIEFYNTPDISRAWQIIERYDIEYIYLGLYERLYYDRQGLAKFNIMAAEGQLRLVYGRNGVSIYQVLR